MLDCDQKVASRVCANSNKTNEMIDLDKSTEVNQPYAIEIKTGCSNGDRRGRRFCDNCLAEFGCRDKDAGDVLFLESLHPATIGRIGCDVSHDRKMLGED